LNIRSMLLLISLMGVWPSFAHAVRLWLICPYDVTTERDGTLHRAVSLTRFIGVLRDARGMPHNIGMPWEHQEVAGNRAVVYLDVVAAFIPTIVQSRPLGAGCTQIDESAAVAAMVPARVPKSDAEGNLTFDDTDTTRALIPIPATPGQWVRELEQRELRKPRCIGC